jgi:predicted CXXCH cytochrome family protein
VTGIRSQTAPARDNPRAIPFTQPVRYNVPTAEEGWADGAVGCEVCHGPGREHVEAVDRAGVERYRRMREAGEKPPTIYDGRSASFELQARQCGQCHDFFTESSVTWQPTPEGFSRPPYREPLQPRADGAWQFYDDGSHKSPCTVVTVYQTSKMWHEQVGCGACHDPHGTRNWADLRLPIENNELCLSCHKETLPDLAAQVAHSQHAADSPGNRCVECHMPRHMVFTNGVQMMSDRIFSHAFSIPTGAQAPGGPPPSCNICHVDRDAAWTRLQIEEMWGE